MPSLRHPSRKTTLVATGALAIALTGSSVAWSATGKTVQLTVDGQPRAVELRGDTVADVLAAAGVSAGEHDVLAPAADRPVEDGDAVALRRGRELQLVVDGVARSVWVTADDVAEALDQVGLRADGAALSASRSREIGLDGLSLDVRLPKDVTVQADGKKTERTTTARTVADLLREAEVAVKGKDRVSVPLTTRLTDGAAVRVTRIGTQKKVSEVPVAFSTVRRDDASLLEGTTKVVQDGRRGLDRRTAVFTTVDGKRKGEAKTTVEHVTEARPRIVAVGTKDRPAPVVAEAAAPRPAAAAPRAKAAAPRAKAAAPRAKSAAPRAKAAAPRAATPRRAPAPRASTPAPRPSSGGLDWAALARCESGGNPRIVSGNGLYFGLYQFSLSTWRSVGGSGRPSDASSSEQTARAQALYSRTGRSSWPHCGRHL